MHRKPIWLQEETVIFNFQEFTRIAAEVYRGMETEESLGRCFDFDETLYVFQAYFAAYEQHTGKPHPPIKSGQIRRIIEAMPTVDTPYDTVDISPKDYPDLIERYFRTDYPYSDRNINHFFSGRIREIKYLETQL